MRSIAERMHAVADLLAMRAMVIQRTPVDSDIEREVRAAKAEVLAEVADAIRSEFRLP